MSEKSIQEYNWWGNDNEPPENLKTKKQLAELGFKPKNSVGVIYTNNYDLYLYDIEDPHSAIPKKKATKSQLENLAKGRKKAKKKRVFAEWWHYTGRHIRDKNESVFWAKEVLKNKKDWVILDTETTGLDQAEIVQIAICNLEGKIILDTLVKPTILIPNEATAIHKITNTMVKDAPTFPEVYPKILASLKDKKVIIYNADFDIRILKYCCKLHNLELLKLRKRTECLMLQFAAYYGDWNDYWESYRWQKLYGGDHSAIGDCLATLSLLKKIGETEIIDPNKRFDKYWAKLENEEEEDSIPF